MRAVLTGARLSLTIGGKPVSKIAAGTYRLAIVDSSKTLDFSLVQTGGEETPLTGVTYTGTKTTTVSLTAGRWKVYSTARPAVAAAFTVS